MCGPNYVGLKGDLGNYELRELPNKTEPHMRWCSVCNQNHGYLYKCKHYSSETQQEIAEQSDKFMSNLSNPDWIAEQKAKGTSEAAINILKIFAGI